MGNETGTSEAKEDECTKEEISDHEANLKLHYDSLRNELDTLIRWSIPLQMNNIKNIMWLNVVLIGIVFQIKSINLYLAIPFFLFSSASIGIALFAMIKGRKIHYANHLRRNYMLRIESSPWSKVNGIHQMFYDIARAVRYNGIVLIKRKKSIAYSMGLTMAALIFFVILVIVNLTKGDQNAQSTTASKTATESIRGENSERSKTGANTAASTSKEVNSSTKAEQNTSKGK